MDADRKRAFQRALYEQFARLAAALASPHRLQILELVANRERSVDDLAGELGLSLANTSQHLQVLRRAQLVSARRDGVFLHYSLADSGVFHLWQALRRLGESRLAEIDRLLRTYLGHREELEAVTVRELRRRLHEGGAVVVDVRPEKEYRAGHIPGALSIPIDELESRLREIPRKRDVVAYCRGPYCVFADEAVALLRSRGYRARRLEVGLPDWRAQGLAVEAGAGASA